MDKNITFSLFLKASLRPERVVWSDGKRQEWGTKSLYIRNKQYTVNNNYNIKDVIVHESKFELENKISKEFQKLEEEQFLLKHNSKNVEILINHIKKLENDITSISDDQIKEIATTELENCKSIRKRFLKWFYSNGYKTILNDIDKSQKHIKSSKTYNSDDEINRELEITKNLLRVTTKKLTKERRKTRFKLGHLSDEDIAKEADECRFKSEKLNLTKLGITFGVDADTVKNELSRRNLTYLLNPLKPIS